MKKIACSYKPTDIYINETSNNDSSLFIFLVIDFWGFLMGVGKDRD
jgi:hypothetical protein